VSIAGQGGRLPARHMRICSEALAHAILQRYPAPAPLSP